MKMKKSNNIAQLQRLRESDSRYNRVIQDKFLATPELISRLGLYGELDGHSGCVNCLEWSSDGKLLASGSDDVQVVIWDAFRKKQLVSLPTGHNGNIFTVKFLPNTENRTIVSGAADYSVRIHDAVAKEVIGICTCHTNRVKRCVTDPCCPSLFWSAGEDGVVIQHDLRVSHNCPAPEVKKSRNVLVDLKQFVGAKAEAKCLAINPVKSDYIAVGANDPFVRIYDRRMIKEDDNKWNDGAVQYFVPGHLPSKIGEYKKKYRSLASTYLTFSPDGEELLVNLGGEQIYLFPLANHLQTRVCNFVVPDSSEEEHAKKEASKTSTNGYSNGYKNGTTTTTASQPTGVVNCDIFRGMRHIRKPPSKISLPAAAELLKTSANKAFELRKYAKAVHLYNEGLKICPLAPVLYGNRAAALLKRSWDGDIYAALKDCQIALYLDPDHYKAHLRMCRCLLDLKRFQDASECLRIFKSKFPEHTKLEICQSIDKDLSRLLTTENNNSSSATATKASSSTSNGNSSSSSTLTREQLRAQFLRVPSASASGDASSEIADDEESSMEHENEDESENVPATVDHSSDSNSSFTSAEHASHGHGRNPVGGSGSGEPGGRKGDLHEMETTLRDNSVDFQDRYCGHCNTTTDIKEANFFGGYIVAGSDDGSFFIWDKETTNIVKIIKGDESIVNCLQPHPSTCCLATSGIESIVRLWSPMPEEGYVNDRVVEDVNDAANANQKRMNSNPFEVILMNMGYRMGTEEDGSDDDDTPRDAHIQMPCNPS